ncbi:hypothetical protein NBH15_03500 [Parabacteroides sp. W1-Q-101]|uniref:hypothetical protein n=1 Tax=Parabacteroides caeci TaxID=2949650 RepID=UPI002030B1B1|nr:hypothetical protein [Parabacteroides sp. W1-Q-101]MCM0717337.1 hypothetical protein [Parabacteroides sp. W1-Q-101]
METYALHRMNSYADILSVKDRMGEELFNSVRDRIYRDLRFLDVSMFYPLDATWTDVDIEAKVRICCLFISEDKSCSYVMTSDYKKIIHKYKNEQYANIPDYFSPDAIRFRAGSFHARTSRAVQPAQATGNIK